MRNKEVLQNFCSAIFFKYYNIFCQKWQLLIDKMNTHLNKLIKYSISLNDGCGRISLTYQKYQNFL